MATIQRRQRCGPGTPVTWRVRWRDDGGRERSRTFRREDALLHRPAPPPGTRHHDLAAWVVMTIMVVMGDTLPLAEVKARFPEVVDRVATTHDRVVVTRNGRPAAVLMSPDDLAALEETLAILSDPDSRTRIDEARQAIADGDVVDEDVLRRRLDELRHRTP